MSLSILCFYVRLNKPCSGRSRYSHTDPTIISGVRVIDGLGNKPKENQDILIVNGKIAAIGSAGSLDAPKGALKIDGAGMTSIPGLIDPHIHLLGD